MFESQTFSQCSILYTIYTEENTETKVESPTLNYTIHKPAEFILLEESETLNSFKTTKEDPGTISDVSDPNIKSIEVITITDLVEIADDVVTITMCAETYVSYKDSPNDIVTLNLCHTYKIPQENNE